MNEKNVGCVTNGCAARTDVICDGWRQNRVFNGKRRESDPVDFHRHPLFDQLAIVDLAALQSSPRLLRCEDRAGRTVFQAPGVVGMSVGEDDRVGTESLKLAQPIETAVDHDSRLAMRDEQ